MEGALELFRFLSGNAEAFKEGFVDVFYYVSHLHKLSLESFALFEKANCYHQKHEFLILAKACCSVFNDFITYQHFGDELTRFLFIKTKEFAKLDRQISEIKNTLQQENVKSVSTQTQAIIEVEKSVTDSSRRPPEKPTIMWRDCPVMKTHLRDKNSFFIISALDENGYMATYVGGYPRDSHLGERPHDFDVATAATPKQISALFSKVQYPNVRSIKMVGHEDYSHMLLFFDNEQYVEVSTYRKLCTETSDLTEANQHKVEFSNSIETDPDTRDTTMNAMHYNPLTGKIYDKFGGLSDLALRTSVLVPTKTPDEHFQQDPIRMLRFIRQGCHRGLFFDKSALDAVVRNASRLKNIKNKQKLFSEVNKMLLTGMSFQTFQKLGVHGLLKYIFPDLDSLLSEPTIKYHLTNNLRRIDAYHSRTEIDLFFVLLSPVVISYISLDRSVRDAIALTLDKHKKSGFFTNRFSGELALKFTEVHGHGYAQTGTVVYGPFFSSANTSVYQNIPPKFSQSRVTSSIPNSNYH